MPLPAATPANLSETDGARFTWSQLSDGEKQAARDRALEDYTKYGCWGQTATVGEVMKRDPQAQIYSGTWVDKAIVRNGKLIGKCRYTPRGFEER